MRSLVVDIVCVLCSTNAIEENCHLTCVCHEYDNHGNSKKVILNKEVMRDVYQRVYDACQ